MKLKDLALVIGVLVVVILGALLFNSGDEAVDEQLAGKSRGTINLIENASYQVNGSDVIDSSGNVDASITSDTGTFSSTLDVTGETSVQGFTQGGGCTASTTVATTELWTEADLLGSNCFTYSGGAGTAAITITLPATSTMTTLMPNAGDTRAWFYNPSAYAAATTTTFAAGAGIILMEPDGQNVVIAGATSAAWLECIRLANTDVSCTVDEVVDAD